jgi:hypothetical protein
MFTIHCPDCNQPLTVKPDALGKRLHCPARKTTFLAEVRTAERDDTGLEHACERAIDQIKKR